MIVVAEPQIDLTVSEQDRFWSHVHFTDTCWLWTGALNRKGYGQWKYRGKVHRAHRIAFELYELIPEDLELDHLCRVRRCVKRTHLEAVTHQENIRRGERGDSSKYNTSKIHCPYAHPLDAINNRGGRFCRTCSRTRQTAYYHRKKIQIVC